MRFSTQTYVSHHDPIIYAFVRCLADQTGWWGINGKGGQNDDRIQRKGYVRIVWPTRAMARRFQRLVQRRLGLRSRRFRVK